MAKNSKKQTASGRKQDRARVAGGQDYEVSYEARKNRQVCGSVKKTVKKVGNSRKQVERRLGSTRRNLEEAFAVSESASATLRALGHC